MQTDNPLAPLSAYIPVSVDDIVETNMAGRAWGYSFRENEHVLTYWQYSFKDTFWINNTCETFHLNLNN
jgi:hypothetical protein